MHDLAAQRGCAKTPSPAAGWRMSVGVRISKASALLISFLVDLPVSSGPQYSFWHRTGPAYARYFFRSYPASFSMLCTRQYSRHCTPTLCRPRSVNRFNRLLCRMLPNTGSTVPMRRL